jgi:hypothetical protein
MNSIFKLFILILLCAVATSLNAQNEYNDGSVYSYLGVGSPIDFRSSQGAGMGLSGVAISNRLSGNISNPALWSSTYFTLANGGIIFNYYNAKDDFANAERSNLSVNHFQVQLPLLRESLGLSISLHPVTESRFSISQDSEYLRPQTAPQDTIRYNVFNRGDGGLNRLELGLGYRINKNFSVGYAGSVVFGVQKNVSQVSFYTPGYAVTTENQKNSAIGMGNRFGVHTQFTRLFSNNDLFALGATVSLPVNLKSTREVTVNIGSRDVDLSNITSNDASLPLEYNVGLAYYVNQYLLLSAESLVQNWSDYKNFAGFNEDFLTDRVKLGFGFEYAAIRRPESSLFTSFIYRGGVSFDSGHLELNNQQIQTMLFTVGLGIPALASGSSIDVNFDFGLRGTTSHELVREKIYAVRVTFNLSEIMFLQRRLQ